MLRSGHGAQLPTISEVGQLRGTSTQLRRELEQCRKELAGDKAQLEAAQNQLRQADLSRAACDEYARRLEQKLEKSGKGVALLKASRLQSDLEFLEKENQIVFSDLQSKDKEILKLQEELQRQHGLVDQASRQMGLPSRQTLEELYDLRQQVTQMTESLGDKDDQLKRQAADLQDFNVYRSDYKRVKERCDEVELLLQRAEEDKAALLDYVEELRRSREQDQAKVEELMASRDDSRRQTSSLEVKRAELEQLLKEQLQVLQATKQQSDVHEVQAEKHRRACSELSRERGELHEVLQACQRQHSLLELELGGMQEAMRGVLDLSRAQQVELNARVDGLTHRITAALATAAGAAVGPGGGQGQGQAQNHSLVIAMSRVSRQQEALIEQHLQLKQGLRGVVDTQQHNEQLKAKVLSLEQEQRRLQEERGGLEARLNELSFGWSLLEAAVRPGGSQGTQPGKEAELVKYVQSELAQARADSEALREQCAEQAREREQLLRTVAGLKESVQMTQAAMAELPPAEDFSDALARSSRLEGMVQQLQQQLRSQEQELRSKERAAAEVEALHSRALQLLSDKADGLQASLGAGHQEQQQLHDLVHRARALQVEAVHEAASAKQVIQQQEQDILQLRSKLQLAMRPLPRPEQHEADALEIRALREDVAELGAALSAARDEATQLREQLDAARSLHGAAVGEARAEQQRLESRCAKAERACADAVREGRERLEEQAAKAGVLRAEAVRNAREQLQERLEEEGVLRTEAVRAAQEQAQGQLQQAAALHAEAMLEAEERQQQLRALLEQSRAQHEGSLQEARQAQQQLREALAKAGILQGEATREAVAAKQAVQQLEQEVLELRTKLALRPAPSRSRQATLPGSKRVTSDDRVASGLDQMGGHVERTPWGQQAPNALPTAYGPGWEETPEPRRGAAWQGASSPEASRVKDQAVPEPSRHRSSTAHAGSDAGVHFRGLLPPTPSSSEDGGDTPGFGPRGRTKQAARGATPAAAAAAQSNLFQAAAPPASKTTAKLVQAQLAALSASYKTLRNKS